MESYDYDIIIVGGGPGGAVCAKTAADKGLKTLFIERGRKSGEKNSSGCGLGPRIWREFPEIMNQMTPDKVPQRACRWVIVHWLDPNGDDGAIEAFKPQMSVTYEPAKSWIVMNVYRSHLDPFLTGIAEKAGAELMTSTLVKDLVKNDLGRVTGVKLEDGREITSKIVIGADGAKSMVANKSGIREKWGYDDVVLVPQYDFHVPKENIDRFFGEEGLFAGAACATWWGTKQPSAYQVYFEDGFHVGCGNWMGFWDKNPFHYLNNLVETTAFQRVIKTLGAEPREAQIHLLPWTTDPGLTYTDNVMLIGDAGGFPCPLEGEGVFPAMETGKIAAEVAAEQIKAGDTSKYALKKYEDRWRKSSTGIEFEAGPELLNFWKGMAFDLDNLKWMIPLLNEIRGGFNDWSEPHMMRISQIMDSYKKHKPQINEFMPKYALPVIAKVFEIAIEKEPSRAKRFVMEKIKNYLEKKSDIQVASRRITGSPHL